MTKTPLQDNNSSALTSILSWALKSKLPSWQMDALRRIITQETIGNDGFQELELIARDNHSILPENTAAPTALPLEAKHIPATKTVGNCGVCVLSISDLEKVNGLPSDQALKFDPGIGLNVIYGDNGAGKSGYARVIKKACRTRGQAPKILADIFAAPNTDPASAKIKYSSGGVDHTSLWKDAETTDPNLSQVFVFDSISARHYLSKSESASFTPMGLDVLPKLAFLCEKIRKNIKQELNAIELQISKSITSWPNPDLPTLKFLKGLNKSSNPAEIDAKAKEFTKQSAAQITTLQTSLQSDPEKIANATKSKQDRTQTLINLIIKCRNEVDDEAVKKINDAITVKINAASNLNISRSHSFNDTDLPNTGSEIWRLMYDAAEKYSSEEAYPGVSFPDTENIAKCLLCQSDLDVSSRERLKRFREFIEGKEQSKLDDAVSAQNQILDRLNKMEKLTTVFKASKSDIDESPHDLSEQTKTLCDLLESRLQALTTAIEDQKAPQIEPFSDNQELISQLKDFKTNLSELEKRQRALVSDDARKKTQSELDELLAIKWVSENTPAVKGYLEDLKTKHQLESCISETQTTKITTQSTKLSKQFITDRFINSFDKEISNLNLWTIKPELREDRGQKGELRFKLAIKSSPKAPLIDVASEGEQRCIALAAFMAELAQASHKSALVFDDPVSSLDHTHRTAIAKRLAQEAQFRQVIVFTHDTVFLFDLCEAAKKLKCNPTLRRVEWANMKPGSISDGLPWDAMPPKQRIDELQKDCSALKKSWQPKPNDDNKKEIADIYDKLRATVERVVEQVALAGVVIRFKNYINLSGLEKILLLDQSHCDELNLLFKKCCDVVKSHDSPQGRQQEYPNPDELTIDIESLNSLRKQITALHKGLKKANEEANKKTLRLN